MAELIPFIPSENNYRLVVPLDGATYVFDTHWNARDNAWYFDLYADDETIIAAGLKVVVNVMLGRTSTHDFFTQHMLKVVDTSGKGLEAGYDDLGARVQVIHRTVASVLLGPTT